VLLGVSHVEGTRPLVKEPPPLIQWRVRQPTPSPPPTPPPKQAPPASLPPPPFSQTPPPRNRQTPETSRAQSPFYSFKLKDVDGKPYDMGQLKGKVVLVVHTATACGLTPQFSGLQALVSDYGRKGFVVLGQPCNQFGAQNPENDAATKRHAVSNFGFTGTLLAKADVNGPDASPLFEWLRSETSGLLGSDFKWNFSKVRID